MGKGDLWPLLHLLPVKEANEALLIFQMKEIKVRMPISGIMVFLFRTHKTSQFQDDPDKPGITHNLRVVVDDGLNGGRLFCQ